MSFLHFLFCGFALFSQSGFPNDCETPPIMTRYWLCHPIWKKQFTITHQPIDNEIFVILLRLICGGKWASHSKTQYIVRGKPFFVILLSWKTPVFELMRGKISNFPSIKKRKTPWLMIYYRNDVLSLIVIRENPITEVLFCFGLFDVEMLASRSLKETVILKINTTISPVKTWDLFELNFSVNSTLTLLCQKILNDF